MSGISISYGWTTSQALLSQMIINFLKTNEQNKNTPYFT